MARQKRYRETITVEAFPLFELMEETAAQLRGKGVPALPPELVELPAAEICGPRTRSGRRSRR